MSAVVLQLHSVVHTVTTSTLKHVLIFLQTFYDGASVLRKCSVERLESILSPSEARHNRLIVSSYKDAVHEFCNEGQSGDKILIVAFCEGFQRSIWLPFVEKKELRCPQINISCRARSAKRHEVYSSETDVGGYLLC